MSEKTGIHWTDSTWTPVTGCHKVSSGCINCYAEALSLRHGWSKKPWTAPNAAENVVLHPDRLNWPLKWRTPRRIFVTSMGDLFHERVPDAFIDTALGTIAATPHHTYQVLTKRSERMRDFFLARRGWCEKPWPNVWLGVSVEDQRSAHERIPHLLATPAYVRWLSAEPLLGPLDFLAPVAAHPNSCDCNSDWCGWPQCSSEPGSWGIHWVVAGGESGREHRPMDPDWARSLRNQCQAAGVAFFFKQSSGTRPGMDRELDGRLWEQFPAPITRETGATR